MNYELQEKSLYHVDQIRKIITSQEWFSYDHNKWLIPYYERLIDILEDAQGYLDYRQLYYFMENSQDIENTYNAGCEMVLQYGKINEIGFVAVHLSGDVRCNYTDYFILDAMQFEEVLCIISEVLTMQEEKEQKE